MWNQNDFCDADSGFDYIFSTMNAIYGARFETNWQNVDPQIIRQVWKERLGRFLTYKPSLDYALEHLKGEFPPSAVTFREMCNAGPNIPDKPVVAITRQKTQAEIAEGERVKAEALAKLAALRQSYTV
jgi:hypothetical protein